MKSLSGPWVHHGPGPLCSLWRQLPEFQAWIPAPRGISRLGAQGSDAKHLPIRGNPPPPIPLRKERAWRTWCSAPQSGIPRAHGRAGPRTGPSSRFLWSCAWCWRWADLQGGSSHLVRGEPWPCGTSFLPSMHTHFLLFHWARLHILSRRQEEEEGHLSPEALYGTRSAFSARLQPQVQSWP